MTATATAPTPTPDIPARRWGRGPYTRRQLLVRIALAIAILFIVFMWIYAFVFASDAAVARIDDVAWTKRAEEICLRRNDLLDANSAHIRETGDGSPQSVGVGVKQATDIIETALDDVLSVQPPSLEDQKLVGEWERLYRIYIQDRRATEVKLAKGEKAELNETTLDGSPISAAIGDFTKPNYMDACSVPTGS
ncbi:MAG: hypothetical protein JWL72_2906 [Ilumatobacteraceae bacterium]|nr:hypothetical protein [Ilumatobacteraceae bacterium]MCU1389568.1 hypothetical protein [Ilumatobacteraceae bacterium]